MIGEIIYPGTFDPITNGHVDIINRASGLFRRVIVAVAENSSKMTFFTLAERAQLVKSTLVDYSNVEVCVFSCLLIDFVRDKNIFTVLRGFRANSDFENEIQLARIYRQMDYRIETLLLPASEGHSAISSSMVREIASYGGDVSLFVPKEVELAFKFKFS